MHDPGPASVGEALRAIAEQAACRNAIPKPNEPLPWLPHLEHLAAPRPELLDDRAEKVLGHIDHQLLVRLEPLAVHADAGDDARTRDLELVALPAHRLHQDPEVQLTAAGYSPRVRRVGVLDAQRDVPLELPHEPLPHLSRRDEPSLLAHKRRVVDEE